MGNNEKEGGGINWWAVLIFVVIAWFALSMGLSMYNESLASKDPLSDILKREQDKDRKDGNTKSLLTVLLFDMAQTGVVSNTYKHKYRIIKDENGKVTATDTDWVLVTSEFFNTNESNLGMELAALDSTNKFWKMATPPGYTNFIGNKKYGYFSNGNFSNEEEMKFISDPLDSTQQVLVSETVVKPSKTSPEVDYWQFYPQYQYIKDLLQIPPGKIHEKEHATARRYHGGFLIFYGSPFGGRRRYGTYSSQYSSYGGNKSWRRGGGGYGK